MITKNSDYDDLVEMNPSSLDDRINYQRLGIQTSINKKNIEVGSFEQPGERQSLYFDATIGLEEF